MLKLLICCMWSVSSLPPTLGRRGPHRRRASYCPPTIDKYQNLCREGKATRGIRLYVGCSGKKRNAFLLPFELKLVNSLCFAALTTEGVHCFPP